MSINNNDYIFATSRVRGMEAQLLTADKASKMADSKTSQDALKVLVDLGYSIEEGKEVTAAQTDQLLGAELKKSYEAIIHMAPDKSLFLPFQLPYDYHNLKTLLKGEFAGVDPKSAMMNLGSYTEEAMVEIIRERNLVALTPTMRIAVEEVLETFPKTKNPQIIDFVLDLACYKEMLELGVKGGCKFIEDYIRLTIDIINLKTFARLREMGMHHDQLQRVFIPGGKLELKMLEGSYEEAYEAVAEKLLAYGLKDVMATGGQQIRNQGRFTLLERDCDDYIMQYVQSAKYVSFGPEALVGYLIAKEGEVKLARIILAGVAQGLGREQLEERMRKTYV